VSRNPAKKKEASPNEPIIRPLQSRGGLAASRKRGFDGIVWGLQ
jgi:hypothetical protein